MNNFESSPSTDDDDAFQVKVCFFKASLFPLLLPDKVVIGAFPS